MAFIVVGGATFIAALVFVCCGYAFRMYWLHSIEEAQRLRVRLLCNTDHEALLTAGREVLSQVPREEQTHNGDRVRGYLPLPKGVRIPQTIRNLRPRGILVNKEGYLTLEMHGGMAHFGVRIYPKGFEQTGPPFFCYGHRKLAEGLWYYDDGYDTNPEYDKIIDQLMEECTKRE